jgi:hypothetical protein
MKLSENGLKLIDDRLVLQNGLVVRIAQSEFRIPVESIRQH